MTASIAALFAMGELARPGHGKDVSLSLGVDAPQGLIGTKARLAGHDDLFTPGGGLAGGAHVPKQLLLMSLDVGINRRDGNR
jgi:hypothetical protein